MVYFEQIERLAKEVYGHVKWSGSRYERLGRVDDVSVELPTSIVLGAEVVVD